MLPFRPTYLHDWYVPDRLLVAVVFRALVRHTCAPLHRSRYLRTHRDCQIRRGPRDGRRECPLSLFPDERRGSPVRNPLCRGWLARTVPWSPLDRPDEFDERILRIAAAGQRDRTPIRGSTCPTSTGYHRSRGSMPNCQFD